MTRYPLTVVQLRQLHEDLARMHSEANEITTMLTAAYGDSDERAVRASETVGAIQRLRWQIERAEQPSDQAAGGESKSSAAGKP